MEIPKSKEALQIQENQLSSNEDCQVTAGEMLFSCTQDLQISISNFPIIFVCFRDSLVSYSTWNLDFKNSFSFIWKLEKEFRS